MSSIDSGPHGAPPLPAARDADGAPPVASDARSNPGVTPSATPEPTLGALVTSWTRRANDESLATLVVFGIVGTLLVALLAPSWWRLAPLLLLMASAGGWGIAERERGHGGRRRRIAGVVRALAVLTGLVAVLGGVLAFMGLALGRWIS
jgi:hypothetical protein